MVVKVGDIVRVNYTQGPYTVKDYFAVVEWVGATWAGSLETRSIRFKAPNALQGNPHGDEPGGTGKWTLECPWTNAAGNSVELYKPKVGDTVLITGGMDGWEPNNHLDSFIGEIATVAKISPNNPNMIKLLGTGLKWGNHGWWYHPEAFTPMLDGTGVIAATAPAPVPQGPKYKVINRKDKHDFVQQ